MRALLLIAFGCTVAACAEQDPGPGFPGPGSGDPNPGGPGFTPCTMTSQCTGTDVCARDEECLDPSQVRSVMARWTVQGSPASATSCDALLGAGALQITYSSTATGELTGFSPLMCAEGQFFVDIWPTRYDHVKVSAGSTMVWSGDADLPDGNADVTVDLQPQ